DRWRSGMTTSNRVDRRADFIKARRRFLRLHRDHIELHWRIQPQQLMLALPYAHRRNRRLDTAREPLVVEHLQQPIELRSIEQHHTLAHFVIDLKGTLDRSMHLANRTSKLLRNRPHTLTRKPSLRYLFVTLGCSVSHGLSFRRLTRTIVSRSSAAILVSQRASSRTSRSYRAAAMLCRGRGGSGDNRPGGASSLRRSFAARVNNRL